MMADVTRASVVYGLLVATARLLYRVMGWRVEVVGGHLLPRTGPVVLVANHVSHVDPLYLAIAAARHGRRLSFLGKREVFQHPVLGPLGRWSDQIEVDRGGLAGDAVGAAVGVLRRGGAVCVFAEGTISPSFVPAPPRPGAARIAVEASVPLVPVALWGGQRIITKGRNAFYTRRVVQTVRFGAPIIAEGSEDPRQLTARAWQQVMHLVEASTAAYPQAPSGPEDRWWVPAHLGGTAPTVQEGHALLAREEEARRRRRQAELGSD